MSKTITPFANESEVIQVGELTLENRFDRVSLFGSLDLTKDQSGLTLARELLAQLQHVVSALEEVPDLPADLEAPLIEVVANPFGAEG